MFSGGHAHASKGRQKLCGQACWEPRAPSEGAQTSAWGTHFAAEGSVEKALNEDTQIATECERHPDCGPRSSAEAPRHSAYAAGLISMLPKCRKPQESPLDAPRCELQETPEYEALRMQRKQTDENREPKRPVPSRPEGGGPPPGGKPNPPVQKPSEGETGGRQQSTRASDQRTCATKPGAAEITAAPVERHPRLQRGRGQTGRNSQQ